MHWNSIQFTDDNIVWRLIDWSIVSAIITSTSTYINPTPLFPQQTTAGPIHMFIVQHWEQKKKTLPNLSHKFLICSITDESIQLRWFMTHRNKEPTPPPFPPAHNIYSWQMNWLVGALHIERFCSVTQIGMQQSIEANDRTHWKICERTHTQKITKRNIKICILRTDGARCKTHPIDAPRICHIPCFC